MAAKFDISKDKVGKFRFHLKAGNGEIIAASRAYDTKASAEKGIESVKTEASGATVVDLDLRPHTTNPVLDRCRRVRSCPRGRSDR